MSQIRAVLRSTALRTEDPAELLTRLDEHVQYFLPDTMATALCGILSPAATTLHTSSAGHLPPILAAPHDVATIVTIPVDLPLGVKSGRPRHSIHVPLPRGFVLCLYTDGLVERRGVVVDDNIEKLRRTVTVQASEAVCIDVMQQLVGPATPEDDVAVLVARDLATAQPTT